MKVRPLPGAPFYMFKQLFKPNDPDWSLDQALTLIRALQPLARKRGLVLALGGSVLNNGKSYRNLDIVVHKMSGESADWSYFKGQIEKFDIFTDTKLGKLPNTDSSYSSDNRCLVHSKLGDRLINWHTFGFSV